MLWPWEASYKCFNTIQYNSRKKNSPDQLVLGIINSNSQLFLGRIKFTVDPASIDNTPRVLIRGEFFGRSRLSIILIITMSIKRIVSFPPLSVRLHLFCTLSRWFSLSFSISKFIWISLNTFSYTFWNNYQKYISVRSHSLNSLHVCMYLYILLCMNHSFIHSFDQSIKSSIIEEKSLKEQLSS